MEPCRHLRILARVCCATALSVGVFALSLGFWPQSAFAEIFILQSGTEVHGTLIMATRSVVYIRRDTGGLRPVPTAELAEVCLPDQQGGQMVGRLLTWNDGIYRLAMKDRVVEVKDGIVLAELAPEQSKSPLLAAAGGDELSGTMTERPIERRTVSELGKLATAARALEAETNSEERPGAGGPMLEFRDDDTQEPAIQIAETTTQTTELQDGRGPLTVRTTETSIREGDSEMTFAVTLSRPADQPIAVLYATADGTATAGLDYEPTQGVMVFEPGESQAEVSAPVINDEQAEASEHFNLFLSVDPNVAEISASIVAGVIEDDD